ncbi:hypothetical protein D3C80_1729930 [compost metagenome]
MFGTGHANGIDLAVPRHGQGQHNQPKEQVEQLLAPLREACPLLPPVAQLTFDRQRDEPRQFDHEQHDSQ